MQHEETSTSNKTQHTENSTWNKFNMENNNMNKFNVSIQHEDRFKGNPSWNTGRTIGFGLGSSDGFGGIGRRPLKFCQLQQKITNL